MKNLYNKNYFEFGKTLGISAYENYQWMPEETLGLCFTLIENLDIKEEDTILDFGCAKGFLVRGFRILHRQAFGVDISEYAINNCPVEVKSFINLIEPYQLLDKKYDFIIAKDVLEHFPYSRLSDVLVNLRQNCRCMFCLVPLGDSNGYYIQSCSKDISHIICQDLVWWKEIFQQSGFGIELSSYTMKHIERQNVQGIENGVGFFILKGDGKKG